MSKIAELFEELLSDVLLELERLQLLQASATLSDEECAAIEHVLNAYRMALGTLNEEIRIARQH